MLFAIIEFVFAIIILVLIFKPSDDNFNELEDFNPRKTTNKELAEKWNKEHPDDPVEV